MTKIHVVGGVYWEKCAFPYWNELYGSAGRAAAALAARGCHVVLHTILSKKDRQHVELALLSDEIEVLSQERETEIEFDYLHCLSTPKIHPVSNIKSVQGLELDEGVVVKFGMLECNPKVMADTCVYDPQSPHSPILFSKSGSKAKRLAIVANKSEILRMADSTDVDKAVNFLLKSEKAEVVLVKNGLYGATVFVDGRKEEIPAFKARDIFTIGSGDVFVAAFAYAWALMGKHAIEAGRYASLSVAEYVESRTFPIGNFDAVIGSGREAVVPKGGRIYLAGPFREIGQRMLIDDAREQLYRLGMSVFSPIHDVGPGSANQVVQQDLAGIRECDAVFALLNGSSPGTVFEVGYAIALGKPVYCAAQNMRDVDLKLPIGAGAHYHEDYVSALHQLAWRT